jgi:Fe-S-cluster containining protein
MNSVVHEKHTLHSKFNFRCHKGIKCFTKCCSDIEILLTPYDVIRLKNRLKLSSEEFLEKYTYMKTDEISSHPYAILIMSGDDKKCPFVSDEGCAIYTDRPASCRYYPVGQGIIKKEGKDGPVNEEFYFFTKEPHCFGYDEANPWTIESWRQDQDVDLYDSINLEWKSIQLRKNLPGQPELDENKQFQFFMASYDMDRFRRFVFDSDFLNIFDIDDETISSIRDDEVELMKFGTKYIKYIMMMEETLKMKKGAGNRRKHKKK